VCFVVRKTTSKQEHTILTTMYLVGNMTLITTFVIPSFMAKTECITFMYARIKFHT
jgi:hypothetical protein